MSNFMPAPHSAGASNRPVFLNTPQAAKHLGLSPSYLNKSRISGKGPCFRKIGRRVLYRLDEIEQWADMQRVYSTSDPAYRQAA